MMIRQESVEQVPSNVKVWSWKLHDLYLIFVSFLGLLIILHGIYAFPMYQPRLIFAVFALMAVTAQIVNTSIALADDNGITFEVGTAVAAAAIPLFGLSGAALIVVLSSLSIWLLKSRNTTTWKKSWRQLFFNTGMWSVSIYVAGIVFWILQDWLGIGTILGTILPWIIVGILIDQLNIWLLLGMVRLQKGSQVNILDMWRSNLWASIINIAIISLGGGFLAYAAANFGWMGTVIFFLPIILSSYAFMLYVRQMKSHMDNLEQIIAERTAELSEVMQDKDAFLALLTHDMKTPLTTIGMYAEIMIREPDIALRKPKIPHAIRDNQKVLIEMVNNILDLENIQVGGELKLRHSFVDLIPILDYLAESIEIQAERKNIYLDHHFAVPTLELYCDPKQIERVVQNLLSNAIKYTPSGGQIKLEVLRQADSALLIVTDNGYGIPEADLPYIFDRFHRVAKHERLAAGTGLGLAIAKAIIEAHHGELTVTSQEKTGTTFSVRLPLSTN